MATTRSSGTIRPRTSRPPARLRPLRSPTPSRLRLKPSRFLDELPADEVQRDGADPVADAERKSERAKAGFDAIKDEIKPETSDTYEIGARYNTPTFNGVLGAYLVNFHDRLLGVASGPDILGSPSVLQNVGSVRSIGFEAAGDWKITNAVSLFASYTYTDATYRDDVFDGAGLLVAATAGKTVVDAPKHMAKGEINYDDGNLFGRFAVNYMSRRYFNYLNDASVPGRLLADATIGYRFGAAKQFEVQLNASNLFDKKYIGAINSAGTGNSGDRQTLLVGAPQQFFATVKAGF